MTLFKPIKIRNLILKIPIILAPLCGITDSPFRCTCTDMGASLTFVEMISSTALTYNSEKTYTMMKTHPREGIIGIQLSARHSEELAQAIEIVDKMNFSIIDINMGCPVKKVVNTGGGSAILKEPNKVYDYVKTARAITQKPLSIKLRAGWDRNSINILETSKAVEEAGADMITVHGRTRADKYSTSNNLEWIKQAKENVSIPVIGNGDLFTIKDVIKMKQETNIDGVMLARGILGNPFLFKGLNLGLENDYKPTIYEWKETIFNHFKYFAEFYEDIPQLVVTMRKHLLWYCKGWRDSSKLRAKINTIADIQTGIKIIEDFVENYDYNKIIG